MRRISFVLTFAVAVLLLAALTAWACTNLATLNLSATTAEAGDRIDVTGTSFATAEAGGQDIVFHWDSVTGEVIGRQAPDTAGTVITTVTVPASAAPGPHVLVATQETVDDDGQATPAYGTPARASVLVGDGFVAPEQVVAGAADPAAAPAGDSTGLIALMIVLGLAGIGLFGAGAGMFARGLRQRAPERTPTGDR